MLSGQSNSGKTTTLNLVYDQLLTVGATIVNPKSQLGGDPDDFECVLSYKAKKVAIFTMGDYSIEVIHAMSYYEGMGCDTLVIANSQKGWPIYRLSRYPGSIYLSKPKLKVAFVQKAANLFDARLIVSYI